MAKKTKNTKTRIYKFCCISYHTEEVIRGVLENRPVRAALYIYHDRDVDKKGEPKPPHWHILICTKNGARTSQVRNWFPDHQNTLGQAMEYDEGSVKYLTHEGCTADKVPYNKEDIREYGQGFAPFVRADTAGSKECESAEFMVDDIIAGTPRRVLVRRYGRDYMRNYAKYEAIAAQIQYEEMTDDQRAQLMHQRYWNKIEDLHNAGIMGDYDFAYYQRVFGDSYNPFVECNVNFKEVKGGTLDV